MSGMIDKTDLDKFKELYKSLGIELVVSETEELLIVKLANCAYGDGGWTVSDKFKGYAGFCGDIQFTKEGEFISQGFWE